MGPRVRKLLILASMLACLAAPAHAIEGSAAPYDGDLERLAEILGSLHYLRNVCGANEGPKWRSQMQALIDAEALDGERKRKVVASFNRGYRVFQQTYRACTPAADIAIRAISTRAPNLPRDYGPLCQLRRPD